MFNNHTNVLNFICSSSLRGLKTLTDPLTVKPDGTATLTPPAPMLRLFIVCRVNSPWDPSRLQFVGNVHIPGPDIKLPLPESQHATQHRARVDPNAHVDVVFRTRSHVSGKNISYWVLGSWAPGQRYVRAPVCNTRPLAKQKAVYKSTKKRAHFPRARDKQTVHAGKYICFSFHTLLLPRTIKAGEMHGDKSLWRADRAVTAVPASRPHFMLHNRSDECEVKCILGDGDRWLKSDDTRGWRWTRAAAVRHDNDVTPYWLGRGVLHLPVDVGGQRSLTPRRTQGLFLDSTRFIYTNSQKDDKFVMLLT